MIRARLTLALLLFAASPCAAAESGGCGAFKWPVDADVALLSQAGNLDSGARIDVSKPFAARLVLGKPGDAGFDFPPERAPAETSSAGVLRFDAKAGTYQVTLTEAAWADLVQGGKALRPIAFSGVKDCEGARKSLRF